MDNAPALTGLAAVLDAQTRVLILGSFPGAASLAAAQYYAHPRNQFWRLLSFVLDEDLVEIEYGARLPRLLAHGFGVWDVLGACQREGSLDAKIRAPQANDFTRLRERCPQLQKVGLNGKTAAKFAPQFAQAGYEVVLLPSSSPAYAGMPFEEKLRLWRALAAKAI